MGGMTTTLGIGFILLGLLLVVTRNQSADLHERLNQKFSWTRWATGPNVMRTSRIANVIVGVGFIILGLVFLTLILG
jgi:hypothetical protein